MPGETCFRCGDTPATGRSYSVEGDVSCPYCDGDPDGYCDDCQHPPFLDWD